MRTNPKKLPGARRRMNVFRFCRRGLTALTVVLALMACDQLLTTGGSGVDIPVKIRAVRVAGGAQNETVTRAGGGGGEKRMVQEPVIQDLGGGMLAEITVEEDVSALRDDLEPLTLVKDVRFRVIAVESGTNKVYSYGDYTVGANNSITRDANTVLHVKTGSSYYFICISYNNSALPDAPEPGDDLSTVTASVTVDGNNLLWQKTEPMSLSEGDDVAFTKLKQQFVKAKLVLAGNGMTITGVAPNSIGLDAATSGEFNLLTHSFSGDGNIDFSGWPEGTISESEVESDVITFLPKTAADYILSLAEGAVGLEDGTEPKSTVAVKAIFLNSKFEAGHSYTIRMSPCKYMQDFSSNACKALSLNQIVTLVDSRNGKAYKIIKLKMSQDGSLARCWMQQNLELANVTCTATDSNVEQDFILPEAISSSLPFGSYFVTDPVDPVLMGVPACSGYFYNWATAIAYSVGHYGDSDTNGDTHVNTLDILPSSGTGVTEGETQYSICPRGWRLPVGSEDRNEFSLVDIHAFEGNVQDWVSDLGFAAIFTGNISNSGSLAFLNEHATFWSSSPRSATPDSPELYVRAPRLLRNNGVEYTDLDYNSFRYIRRSVRCIHDPE